MIVNELNPKAREAFGKSLIDSGLAIFKGLMLLLTVVPLLALLKSVFSTPTSTISLSSFVVSLSWPAGALVLIFFAASFLFAAWLQQEGLRHIHVSEVKSIKYQ
jgi:hypothetical protein